MNDQQSISGQSSGSNTRPIVSNQKVLFIELCSRREDVTLGTATSSQSLVGPVFRDIGPSLSDIVIHGKGYNAVNGFTYAVLAQYSYDGETWEDFGVSPLLDVAAADVTKSRISAVYTNRATFGRYIRFILRVNDNGTANAKAQVSLSVAFHFLA